MNTPQEQTRDNIVNFAKRYLEIESRKEALKADTKALKEEFSMEGVPTTVVIRCLNQIKRNKKKTDSELFEEDAITTWLSENKDIDDSISSLVV